MENPPEISLDDFPIENLGGDFSSYIVMWSFCLGDFPKSLRLRGPGPVASKNMARFRGSLSARNAKCRVPGAPGAKSCLSKTGPKWPTLKGVESSFFVEFFLFCNVVMLYIKLIIPFDSWRSILPCFFLWNVLFLLLRVTFFSRTILRKETHGILNLTSEATAVLRWREVQHDVSFCCFKLQRVVCRSTTKTNKDEQHKKLLGKKGTNYHDTWYIPWFTFLEVFIRVCKSWKFIGQTWCCLLARSAMSFLDREPSLAGGRHQKLFPGRWGYSVISKKVDQRNVWVKQRFKIYK